MPASTRHSPKSAAARSLERACDALLTLDAPDSDRLLCAVAASREQAERGLAAFGAGDPAAAGVVYGFAGALLVRLAADSTVPADLAPEAVELLAARQLASPAAIGREALRSPALGALEPGRAIAAVLAVVEACAGAPSVSVWAPGSTGRLSLLGAAGTEPPEAAAEQLAHELVSGSPAPRSRRGGLVAEAVGRAGLPSAAIVARPCRGGVRMTRALLAEAVCPLGAILERDTLLARNASSERALVQASERRLTRIGFDLHDGPLQELLLVGEDLALFREQLAVVLEGRRGKELLGGRLDDLDARLVALERGLRRISTSVHAGVMVTRPFAEAFEDLVTPFRTRTGIEPAVELTGELDAISQSQRMALLSVVGEALNNIREHSEASAVSVSIVGDEEGVRAHVSDDGRGFDVEAELLRAARRGHMGLAGVYERVRLLGGHCRIESRRGGPSEVAIALPRWTASVPDRREPGEPAAPVAAQKHSAARR